MSNSPDPRHVGTIILKIMQAQRGPGRSSDGLRIVPGALSSEWSSTTGGHCATFSREEVKAPPQSPFTWSTKPMDPDDPHSHVKFIFFYRSMDWLVEHQIADPQSASIHLGNKIQFTVTPQQYPMYPMQGAMLGAPGYTAPPLVPAPIDMKVAQVNTLNPEKKDNDKGKDRVPSNSKPKREKKPKVEEELDDKPYIDPRLTTDIVSHLRHVGHNACRDLILLTSYRRSSREKYFPTSSTPAFHLRRTGLKSLTTRRGRRLARRSWPRRKLASGRPSVWRKRRKISWRSKSAGECLLVRSNSNSSNSAHFIRSHGRSLCLNNRRCSSTSR